MFSSWNMGSCPPNQGQEVDWGVLAQQWIKQKEIIDQWQQQQQWAQQQPAQQQPFIPPPPPPPPPEEVVTTSKPERVLSEPESVSEVTDPPCPIQQDSNFFVSASFSHKHNDTDKRHDSVKHERSWQSNWGNSWGSSWSGPSTHRADYNHGIPFSQASQKSLSEDTTEVWHNKHLANEHSLPSVVEEVVSQPSVDVKKRKLPAWIREGLEKIEREKNRKMLEEVSQTNLRLQHKSPSHVRSESDSETSNPSSVEDKNLNKAKEEPVKDKKSSSDDDCGGSTEHFIPLNLTEEERTEINMAILKRSLTEILLDITNSEMRSLIEEVVSHAKAQARQLVDSTALSRLADVGFSSSNESNGSDESESALQRKAEFKRAEFEKNQQQISHGHCECESRTSGNKKSKKKSKASFTVRNQQQRNLSGSPGIYEKRLKRKRESTKDNDDDDDASCSSTEANERSDSESNVSTDDSSSNNGSSTSSASSCSSSSSSSESQRRRRHHHERRKKPRNSRSSSNCSDDKKHDGRKYLDKKRLKDSHGSKEYKEYHVSSHKRELSKKHDRDRARSNRTRLISSDDDKADNTAKRLKYSKYRRSKDRRKRSHSSSSEKVSSPNKRSSSRSSQFTNMNSEEKRKKRHHHVKSLKSVRS